MSRLVAESARDTERLHVLQAYGVLDTPADPSYDDITRLAARYFDVPIALVSLVDRDRQWFKSRVGLDLTQTPRAVAFCDHALGSPEVMVVEDARLDARFCGNLLVTGAPWIRFYAGAPLVTPSGHVLGTLCIIDCEPRRLGTQQRLTLQVLARQVVALLELHKKNAELCEAMAQMQAQSDRLEQTRVALHAEQRLNAHSMNGIVQARADGRIVAANSAACAMLGLSEDELQDGAGDDLLDRDDPRVAQLLDALIEQGHAHGEMTMVRADGKRFETESLAVRYRDSQGVEVSSIAFRDVSERQIWARKLQDSANLLNSLAQRVPGVIYQYHQSADGRACFPFASEGLWDIYEVRPEQVRDDAHAVFQRIHPKDAERIAASIHTSATSLQRWSQEFRVVLPEQGVRWRQGEALPERLADGSTLWHGYISDITDRKQAESHTHQLAYYDVLTGLPNRRLLMDRIGRTLARAERSSHQGALFFIDLDNFKHINDARGHSAGDALLVQVAARLTAQSRSDDTVSRLGGDEFVVLAGDIGASDASGVRAAMCLAERLRAVLESPYLLDGSIYTITGSIGVTMFPRHTQCADDLLREADTAMYRAKSAGRNRAVCFEPAMQEAVVERLALQQDMKVAIGLQQFVLFVQPQVDGQGREVGAELLLRWNHPVRGNVSPGLFIPIAEESGQILQLGDLVIQVACEALARMQSAGRVLPLSVNVSPRQFHQEDFVSQVAAVLARSGASPHNLIFEVTENLLIDNWDDTLARMSQLVAMGIRFSIDDFGTGYSSLAYLKKLPLYELKIDQSFVRDTPHDTNDTAIVESILSVARHLRLRVVAEGVETREQADFLIASDCDCLQGYLFARPVPLEGWLTEWLNRSGPP